jgi:hypothetical protein
MPSSISVRPIMATGVRATACFRGARLMSLLLILTAIASAQTPSAPAIHGVVLNSVTREPVARALVTSQDDRFAALTDDQGRFSFSVPAQFQAPSDIAPGRMSNGIDLHAGKPGFLDHEGNDISTWPSDDHTDLVFTLTPESLIIGRVNLPSAGSGDRISVQLYRRDVNDGRARWTLYRNASTRVNGDFRFSELPAGTYKLFTDESLDRDPSTTDNNPDGPQLGYPPAYFPTASDFSSSAPITLGPGQTFQAELSPSPRPYYPVRISLPNLQPGTGVSVSVAPFNQSGPGFSLGYNGRGQTIEGLLPSGTYTVEAVSYAPAAASGVLTFTVHDAPVLTPTLLLVPGQSISVNVKKEFSATTDNSPGSGSSRPRKFFDGGSYVNINLVPAEDFSSHPGANMMSRGPDPEGARTLNAVAGRYWLQINNSRGYVASATSAGVDLLLNPLVLGPGGSSAPIDIVLRDDTAEIDGTIEDSSPGKRTSSRQPVVYCVPLPDSAGRFAHASLTQNSAEDVSFRCQNLPPGSYRVLAFEHSQEQLEYHNAEAMRPYESKGPIVRVSGGQKETVRIPLNP